MNSMTIGQVSNSLRDPADEKMEQIRDLLFGEYQRDSEARVVELEVRMRDLESRLNNRLAALEARLEALSGEVQADRRTSFDELARGIAELGQRIRQIPRD